MIVPPHTRPESWLARSCPPLGVDEIVAGVFPPSSSQSVCDRANSLRPAAVNIDNNSGARNSMSATALVTGIYRRAVRRYHAIQLRFVHGLST